LGFSSHFFASPGADFLYPTLALTTAHLAVLSLPSAPSFHALALNILPLNVTIDLLAVTSGSLAAHIDALAVNIPALAVNIPALAVNIPALAVHVSPPGGK
jgi:hypothetical protein